MYAFICITEYFVSSFTTNPVKNDICLPGTLRCFLKQSEGCKYAWMYNTQVHMTLTLLHQKRMSFPLNIPLTVHILGSAKSSCSLSIQIYLFYFHVHIVPICI